MSHLTDHEAFDPLHYHALVHGVHKDLLLIEDSLDGKKQVGHDEEFEECMDDDHHQANADFFIYKIGKQKKKNQSKAARKASKTIVPKDSPSTSDD